MSDPSTGVPPGTPPPSPPPGGPTGPTPTGPGPGRIRAERLRDFDQLVRVIQLLDETALTAFADHPAERLQVTETLRFLRRSVAELAAAAGVELPAGGRGRSSPSGEGRAGGSFPAPGAAFPCEGCSGTCRSRLDCIGQPVRVDAFAVPDVRPVLRFGTAPVPRPGGPSDPPVPHPPPPLGVGPLYDALPRWSS